MAAFLTKYGVARHIYIPIVKRAVVDFAVSADWTPSAGDVKISKDGGAAANVTNLPTAITMGNGAIWDFSLTATELQAAQVVVTVVDAATKAVEDQSFIIETYGNASAQHAVDLADSVRAGLTALPNATPGAANGVLIAGTNAPVTITGSGDALTISSSGGNGVGLKIAGNGSGDGIKSTGGATGAAFELVGGATSGDGLKVTTTSGHGFNIAATGTSMHGITATGGNGGTSDGIKGVAGTGGVDIRGNLTGNVTGNLSGSVGSVTGAVGSVTGAVGSVTGNVGGNVTGSVGSVATGGIAAASFAAGAIDAAAIATDAIGSAELATTAVNEIRDAILSDSTAFAGASIAAIKAKTDNLPEGIKKNTALTNFEFFMADSTDHVTGKTGLTVAGAVSIDGGAFGALTNTPATEVANGIYKIDLAAADLNGTVVTLKFTSAGADATLITIKTCL